MSDLILQLGNAANWSLLYQSHLFAQVVGGTPQKPTYAPIGEIAVPILVESPLVAVLSGSAKAPAYYKSAGYLAQKIQIGTMAGGIPDAYYQSRRKVYLRQIQLVKFERLSSTYQLSFFPHYWLEDLDITVWEYTGTISDTTSALVQTNLEATLRVEQKVDALNP